MLDEGKVWLCEVVYQGLDFLRSCLSLQADNLADNPLNQLYHRNRV